MDEARDAAGGPAAIQWYARSSVDEFLEHAAQERSRLEAVIADATERADQARAAMGLHRLMASMLLETHRQLTERRREAEVQAAQIILQSEREAHALLEAAQARHAGPPTAAPSPAQGTDWVIDLTAPTGPAAMAPPSTDQVPPMPASTTDASPIAAKQHGNGDAPPEDADAFFAYLRAGATSSEPLGPPAE